MHLFFANADKKWNSALINATEKYNLTVTGRLVPNCQVHCSALPWCHPRLSQWNFHRHAKKDAGHAVSYPSKVWDTGHIPWYLKQYYSTKEGVSMIPGLVSLHNITRAPVLLSLKLTGNRPCCPHLLSLCDPLVVLTTELGVHLSLIHIWRCRRRG